MNKLTTLLKEETQSLKEQYIEKTIEWATRTYQFSVEQSKWNEEKWANYLGVPTRIANQGFPGEFVTFHSGFWNTKMSTTYSRLKKQALIIKKLGLDELIKKEVRSANLHYDISIDKLAERIEKKKLNQDNIHLSTSHIDVNIETIITDGDKTVRAFTIIAEGDVQRPHYRYLVK